MGKIRMKKPAGAITLESAFKEFTVSKDAKGVKDKTIETYLSHFHVAGKHLDMGLTFKELTKSDLERMIVSMRNEELLKINMVSLYIDKCHIPTIPKSTCISANRLRPARDAKRA